MQRTCHADPLSPIQRSIFHFPSLCSVLSSLLQAPSWRHTDKKLQGGMWPHSCHELPTLFPQSVCSLFPCLISSMALTKVFAGRNTWIFISGDLIVMTKIGGLWLSWWVSPNHTKFQSHLFFWIDSCSNMIDLRNGDHKSCKRRPCRSVYCEAEWQCKLPEEDCIGAGKPEWHRKQEEDGDLCRLWEVWTREAQLHISLACLAYFLTAITIDRRHNRR